MDSLTFFFLFIPLLALILLGVNFIFAPHNPYQEKGSTFECGFHSFLGQNRTQFSISFFIFALLFLLFDLEILLVYPYVNTSYFNHIYGLIIMLVFFLILTLGFAFELGKNALTIDSKQISLKRNIVKSEVAIYSPFIAFIEVLHSMPPWLWALIGLILSVLLGIVLTMDKDQDQDEGHWSRSTFQKVLDRCIARGRCPHTWVPAPHLNVPCTYKKMQANDACPTCNNMKMCCKCAEIRCTNCTGKTDPNVGEGSRRSPSPFEKK